MALNLKDPATHDLARRLAAATGETMTEAVGTALGYHTAPAHDLEPGTFVQPSPFLRRPR